MRYGLDLFTLQRHVNRLMDGFDRVYAAHANGTAMPLGHAHHLFTSMAAGTSFGSLKELLEYQSLYNLTQTSTRLVL